MQPSTVDPSQIMNAEKMGLIGVMGFMIFMLIVTVVALFKYFSTKIEAKDKRIEEMTSLLMESSSVISRFTSGLETNKAEVIASIKAEGSRIVEHISSLFRSAPPKN